MTTTTTVATQVPGSPTAVAELEAAELEGLVPITAEQLAAVRKYRRITKRIAELEAERKDIRDDFNHGLSVLGLQGLLHKGKVLVRRSVVHTPRINTKLLKERHPKIAAEVTEITESVRITVND